MYLQAIILTRQSLSGPERGCLIVQPYNSDVGAGTYTCYSCGPSFLTVGRAYWNRRGAHTDGRYGDNPNRLQQFANFKLSLESRRRSTFRIYICSVALSVPAPRSRRAFSGRLGESDARRLGLGWQVWLMALEKSASFTYFHSGRLRLQAGQRRADLWACRIAMYQQDLDTMYYLTYKPRPSFGELYKRAWLVGVFDVQRRKADAPLISRLIATSRTQPRARRDTPSKNWFLAVLRILVKAAHAFNVRTRGRDQASPCVSRLLFAGARWRQRAAAYLANQPSAAPAHSSQQSRGSPPGLLLR